MYTQVSPPCIFKYANTETWNDLKQHTQEDWTLQAMTGCAVDLNYGIVQADSPGIQGSSVKHAAGLKRKPKTDEAEQSIYLGQTWLA